MIEKIAQKILDNRYITAYEIENILNEIEKSNLYTWRDLSDADNNLGDVRITEQKNHTLVERLTNSIDACIEKKAEKYKEIKCFKNPTQVQVFLEEKGDIIKPEDIIVGIYPHNKKTNFYFQDKGIGIANEDIPYSILKISGSNKKEKDYLMGFYGKGGSSVCRFSPFTIILTGKNNEVSFTIVKYDKENRKYVYLVDTKNKDKYFGYNPKEHKAQKER